MADLDMLRNVLQQTQSPDQAQRREAEEYLGKAERQPGYPQVLVRLIEQHCAGTTPGDRSVRTLGAILFKNLVKRSWEAPDDDDKENSMSEQDKAYIKGTIVHIMCVAPPEVQRQFSEALAIISKHDFPKKWPILLPDLVGQFGSADYHVVLGVLLTANSIFKRFRYVFKSDELYEELAYVLKHVQAPLLELFRRTSEAAMAPSNDTARLTTLFEALRLMARIFFSLNWQDLPEFFEDHMAEWMGAFLRYLSYENPLLIDRDEEREPDPICKLQAAVVENVNLYASKYEDEFTDHLKPFTEAIWGLLMKVGAQQKHDILATTCIRFLTSIVSKQMHAEMFGNPVLLTEILQRIVLPNLAIREGDEELFEDNAAEYIQRDMEGGDNDTRRRCAADLVRGLCKLHEETTTALGLRMANELLAQYGAAPAANWRAKDTALQLLLALSVKAASGQSGVSATNPQVDVMQIFLRDVLPELQDPAVAARPVVRADCLKFVATFRNQFSADQMSAIFPLLIAHLSSDAVVVQTYAAMAVERILLVKDKPPGQRPTPRFGKERLQQFLGPLFDSLFGALDTPQLAENDYLMKAVMRALAIAQDAVLPLAPVVLARLTAFIARACANPANPQFNHYLFESLAVLVGRVCKADAGTVAEFEAALFPPFQQVLQLDVAEFTPYVFQILAQLLEGRPPPFSPAYMALFPPLLSPALWESRGNVPALVQLLSAYIRKDVGALVAAGHLVPMLGIFQKLNASRATEGSGFTLLTVLTDAAPTAAVEPHFTTLLNLMFRKLTSHKQAKYVRLVVHFCCVAAGRHGAGRLGPALEACEPGVTKLLLQQLWIPLFASELQLDDTELHVYSIGSTKMLCECDQVTSDPELWGQLLGATVRILMPTADKGTGGGGDGNNNEDAGDGGGDEEMAYDSAYSRLHFAAASGGSRHLLEGLPSGTAFFAGQLAALCASRPGQFPPIVARALDAPQQAALQAILQRHSVTLV